MGVSGNGAEYSSNYKVSKLSLLLPPSSNILILQQILSPCIWHLFKHTFDNTMQLLFLPASFSTLILSLLNIKEHYNAQIHDNQNIYKKLLFTNVSCKHFCTSPAESLIFSSNLDWLIEVNTYCEGQVSFMIFFIIQSWTTQFEAKDALWFIVINKKRSVNPWTSVKQWQF